MKRRNFVQNTGVGVLGYQILQPFINPLTLFQRDQTQLWFHQLCTLTSAIHRDNSTQNSSEFRKSVELVNAGFTSRGYLHSNPGYHFYNKNETCCFYALEYHHVPSGIVDLLIPVLRRTGDGTWQHFTTINCFQLEALVRAGSVLQEYPEPLQDVLLPVYTGHRKCSMFESKLSEIDIFTTVSYESGARTRVVISVSGKQIFTESFISEHCLTCLSSFV